jgi:putative nucleotidyltransferase with HDIG domain
MTVLIIDDEHSIRTTLRIFLEREGFTVYTADSVEEARERMQAAPVDVIVSDIIMPRISGVDFLAELHAADPDVPVILMTGEPTVDTAVKALQNGAYDYISKPVRKDDLVKIVRQAALVRELIQEKRQLEDRNKSYQENLEQVVRLRTRELDRAMQDTIKVMTSLVDSRDPYTSGHQIRVGNLAAAIADIMGLPAKTVTGLRVTGYLHDIGKIAIPTELLVKPGRLSAHEFDLVKTHAEFGYKLLKDLSLPWPIADYILQHHERNDGSGYPGKIKSPAILLEARILAVADIVEAMASHRPYRASLGITAALAEITSLSGSQLDADCVSACLALFNQHHYVIQDDYFDSSFLVTD